LTPDDDNLYFNRGLAHAKLGAREKAIADYTEAIRLKPDLAIAYHNRGYEHELAGRRDDALADYREAVAVDPRLEPPKAGIRRLMSAQ
jgi:tetratricopeptide (TPR) repeat protein